MKKVDTISYADDTLRLKPRLDIDIYEAHDSTMYCEYVLSYGESCKVYSRRLDSIESLLRSLDCLIKGDLLGDEVINCMLSPVSYWAESKRQTAYDLEDYMNFIGGRSDTLEGWNGYRVVRSITDGYKLVQLDDESLKLINLTEDIRFDHPLEALWSLPELYHFRLKDLTSWLESMTWQIRALGLLEQLNVHS